MRNKCHLFVWKTQKFCENVEGQIRNAANSTLIIARNMSFRGFSENQIQLGEQEESSLVSSKGL